MRKNKNKMSLYMYIKFKKSGQNFLNSHSPRLLVFVTRYKVAVKYAVSGIIAAVVNLSLLLFFTGYLHIWYIISSVIVYIISTMFNFFLLKFWAFRDPDFGKMHKQLVEFT